MEQVCETESEAVFVKVLENGKWIVACKNPRILTHWYYKIWKMHTIVKSEVNKSITRIFIIIDRL